MSRNNKINLDDWYTTEEARQQLSANSGREINSSYPRTLAKNGKITSLDIGSRGKLYLKRDVDAYVVSTQRGPKRDTREARAAGSRRKKTGEEKIEPAA